MGQKSTAPTVDLGEGGEAERIAKQIAQFTTEGLCPDFLEVFVSNKFLAPKLYLASENLDKSPGLEFLASNPS